MLLTFVCALESELPHLRNSVSLRKLCFATEEVLCVGLARSETDILRRFIAMVARAAFRRLQGTRSVEPVSIQEYLMPPDITVTMRRIAPLTQSHIGL
jgi:hypothetical protein